MIFSGQLLSKFACAAAALAAFFPATSYAQGTNCIPAPDGLVSWWRAEGNILDAVGGNHGILFGNAGYAAGKAGQSFTFDGNGDAAFFGNPANLQLQNFTIEAWIKRASALAVSVSPNSVESALVAYGTGGYGLGLSNNGSLYLMKVDTDRIGVATTITDTNWHHVAASKSGTTVIFYVDGVAFPAAAYGSTFTFGSSLAVGANGSTTYSFLGSIDETAIYNRALAAAEVQAISNAGTNGKCIGPSAPVVIVPPTNQVAFVGQSRTFGVLALGTATLDYQWRMEGTNLPGATNTSLTINNIQLTNGGNYTMVITNLYGAVTSAVATLMVNTGPICLPKPDGLVSWWPGENSTADIAGTNSGTLAGNASYGLGKVGQAFVLDGNRDGVQIGFATNLQLQDFSIEGWIKRESNSIISFNGSGGGMIFAMGSSGGYGFYLQPNSVLALGQLQGAAATSAASITDTNWHHVAVTKTNTSVVFFVDGVAYNAPPFSPGSFTFSAPGYIGAWLNPSALVDNSLYGMIDELSIYNRTLSTAEILAIYQAGAGGKCTTPQSPVFVLHPTNQTVIVGDSANFVALALGEPPLTYQWRLNGTNIVNATSATYVIANAQFTNAGVFSVVVSNSLGWAMSSNAVLTVTPPPPCTPAPQGIVSWWRAENNGLDSVGTNNGTPIGNLQYASGRVGQTFVSDGNGAALIVGNPTNLQLQNFSIEAWVRRSSASVASFNAGGTGAGFIFGYDLGGYGFYIRANGQMSLTKVGISDSFSTVMITDTNFHHLAVTKSGGAIVFYVDGVAYPAAAPYDPGFVFTTTAAVGGIGGTYNFYGSVDDLAIYNRPLTAPEIQAIYQAGSLGKCTGPAAPVFIIQPINQTVFVGESPVHAALALGTPPPAYQWFFNGTNLLSSATNATLTLGGVQLTNAGNYAVVASNASGTVTSSVAVLTVNPAPPCATPPSGMLSWWTGGGVPTDVIDGNSGTLVNQATYGLGKVGQAFVFDGNQDGVQVGLATNLQLQNFSIEGWIRRSSNTLVSFNGNGTGLIFGLGNSGGYGFYLRSSGALELGKFGDVTTQPTAGAVTNTDWHHVAVTKTNTSVVFYVDGVAYPSSPYAGTAYTFSAPGYIGAWAGLSGTVDNSFYGTIDELSVYNRALTTNEIQSIYNANLSGKCPQLVPPTIVTHPRSTNAVAGTNVTFTVLAGGSVPFTYQWRLNGVNLAGATNSSLPLSNIQFGMAGNYSVAVTNAAGSALSSNALLTVIYPLAVLRAVSTNVMAGAPVTVPITLAANGNENTFGFSLNFNTQRLAYASSTWGNAVTGASLLLNTSQTNLGRVGFGITFPPGMSIPAGTQTIARITFSSFPLLGGANAFATNTFGDLPIPREFYDVTLQTPSVGYSNSLVTLTPTLFESDVFPRTNGNQAVTTIDLAQVARFVARLDVPTPVTNEFQRADSAPRATLGDGQLKVTDWVQAGRYVAGLDFTAAMGGPTVESAPVILTPSLNRQLSVIGTNITQGQTTTVFVNLDSPGDENAIGFTLTFDPSLAFVSATPGSSSGGANLTVNTTQTGNGRLGVILGLPTGTAYGAGDKELVKITLTATTAGIFPLTLTDQQATRSVSDALANELAASYINGSLTVNPTNPPPPLTIALTGTNALISWPDWAGDFALQMADGNVPWPVIWSNAPATLQTNAGNIYTLWPVTNRTEYFRLRR